MRRVVWAVVGVACMLAILVVVGGGDREDEETYEVAVVFDTAKGLLKGSAVRIAGAPVGTVTDIGLDPRREAVVRMDVDRRFAPFKRDAHCSIRTEGLLGVAVVSCSPGTSASPQLRALDGVPTVPIEQTSVPVYLNDFFQIWKIPVRDRVRVLLTELGLGLSGRGTDLNQLLRRVNPSLTKARRVLDIIEGQREQLADTLTDTERAITKLAADRTATRRLVREGARTSAITAARSDEIADATRRLPALLRTSRQSLTTLDRLNDATAPMLRDLERAGPELDRVARDTLPFARLSRPAITALRLALGNGRRVSPQLGALVRRLERLTRVFDLPARTVERLFLSLRDTGGFEHTLSAAYRLSASLAHFDSVGHLDPTHTVSNGCARYATVVTPECDAHYVKQQSRTTAMRPKKAPERRSPGSKTTEAPSASPPAPKPAAPPESPLKRPVLPQLPDLPDLPGLPQLQLPDAPRAAVADILDFLLGS